MSMRDNTKSRGGFLSVSVHSVRIFLVFLFAFLPCNLVHAVRANWGVRQMGPRLEKKGQHEEAAFYYRAGLDFYTSILQLWIGTVYDERVDEIYQQYAEAFGEDGWRSADYEERWDTMKAYLFSFNRDGVARNVEKGNFSAEQRARLEDRTRIYIEDLMDPDNGFGGDFSFSRKAWILERAGLFWHAAFRRELAGRYATQVCSRYYAAVADEMERVFSDQDRAKLYRQKSEWWRSRGLDEFHLCNGDRYLARIKGGDKLKRLNRDEVITVLKKGLLDENTDARRTAVQILSDMEELEALEPAMQDSEVEILNNREIETEGLRPGALVEYFTETAQAEPITAKVFETVDIGMKFQANFPKVWYNNEYWDKPEIFPAYAQGPFRLQITTKLYIPIDGNYRFYVKTDAPNRAKVYIRSLQGEEREIISPNNDEKLQYAAQVGMATHRIDFSDHIPLKKGLVELLIVYSGEEVRKIHNEHIVRISGTHKAGIQLFWSSDHHLMELVPAANLFH